MGQILSAIRANRNRFEPIRSVKRDERAKKERSNKRHTYSIHIHAKQTSISLEKLNQMSCGMRINVKLFYVRDFESVARCVCAVSRGVWMCVCVCVHKFYVPFNCRHIQYSFYFDVCSFRSFFLYLFHVSSSFCLWIFVFPFYFVALGVCFLLHMVYLSLIFMTLNTEATSR